MKNLMTLLGIVVVGSTLTACSATRSTYRKTPAVFDGPDGESVVMEDFDLDLGGLAGEGILWDNYNKNIALFSTKDDALEGLNMEITFSDTTGEMSGLTLAIGNKTSISSTPSQVAWSGLADVLVATYGENGLAGAIGAVVEAAANGFNPVPDIEVGLPPVEED